MAGTSGAWATLYGFTAEEETEVAFVEVMEWAHDNDIQLVFKEIDDFIIREYGVDEIVTLRYFDYETANPRIERKGLAEILELVLP